MIKKDDDVCRAKIPPMLSQEQRATLVYTPLCRQRWGERQVEGDTLPRNAEAMEEFLTQFVWLKETEVALQCLFDVKFDLPMALQLLKSIRRERYKAQRDRDEQLEPEAFKAAVEAHGKKFHLVKQMLGQQVTTREVVSRYYLWKRTTEFKNWRQRRTGKKFSKKKKEIERLRLDDESPKAETFEGYHNKQCEICVTGGKLLCCDGCPRVYHFSCVQPPITKVSRIDDEWFCQHCKEVFGSTKPKMVSSRDNKYCLVCLPFTGMPRTLIESITDDSSQEEDDELEGNSNVNSDDDAGLALSDVTCDLDVKPLPLPDTEELSLNIGNFGSLIDSECEQKPTPAVKPFALKQQSEAMPSSISSQVAPNRPVERSDEASKTEIKRAAVQISGRKRHRKTTSPRRILPFRTDN